MFTRDLLATKYRSASNVNVMLCKCEFFVNSRNANFWPKKKEPKGSFLIC